MEITSIPFMALLYLLTPLKQTTYLHGRRGRTGRFQLVATQKDDGRLHSVPLCNLAFGPAVSPEVVCEEGLDEAHEVHGLHHHSKPRAAWRLP